MLCPSCLRKNAGSYFWPLTLNDLGSPEFWIPGNMQTCRACYLEHKRNYEKSKVRNNPEYREQRRQQAAKYYEENKEVHNMKHKSYMKIYRQRKRDNAA